MINSTFLFLTIALCISSIPCLLGVYAQWRDHRWVAIGLYALSILLFLSLTVLSIGIKILQHGTPYLRQVLGVLNRVLAPIASKLAGSTIVGPVISIVVRVTFFIWFLVLLMSDQAVRAILGRIVGSHASQHNFSIVNSVDPQFELFDESLEKAKELRGYSLAKAYTLAVMSKLAYEEVGVIKHELAKEGFDVERTFFPMAYKNICAYIAEKDSDVYLIFRGTSPLNIQNFVTDFNIAMMDVRTPRGVSMGKVHKGFWQAMGEPGTASAETSGGGSMKTRLQLELSSASLYRTITSTVQAAAEIVRFGISQLVHHVADPIDNSWIGYDIDIRHHGMYAQAEEFIMKVFAEQTSGTNRKAKRRLYVGGHSLGGALGTIFVAKMMQSESPLLRQFSGLYTFGQPKVGDAEFTNAFYPEISNKLFHHAYNNDLVSRVPFAAQNYQTPPGTLVYINSAYKMTFYPPNPRTNEPVPVRPISFIHLSGLLNANVIRRLAQESWLRAVFRLVFPFFLNDHFPADYCCGIRQGNLGLHVVDEGYVGGNSEFMNDEEKRIRGIDMMSMSPPSYYAPSMLSSTARRPYAY